ncbi:MAG: AAA family ATPase [Saprospiraceae bacterium]
MKRLPLGKQNFEELIEEHLLYVDKTDRIYNLIDKGYYYFLSRPRRFGKSLLISTLKNLFEGKRELFKDLYIGKHTDYGFESYPILHFNFAKLGHKTDNLDARLNRSILEYANEFKIDLSLTSLSENFTNLVKGVAEQGKPVVLLIDEYDKPIIDFFTEIEKAKANRKILRDFFTPLKDLEAHGHLRFMFITGVSKFSKVSLFSDLNNLMDISKSRLSNDLLGITQDELEHNFAEHIEYASDIMDTPKEMLLKGIKDWYNGYSYDGKTTLYNPFSLLNFFTDFDFRNYWFQTGTPTFLVETIRNEGVTPKELEEIEVHEHFFDSFSLDNLDIVGLLYQTGYLTIKSKSGNIYETAYLLGYPNIEVRRSLEHNLVEAFSYKTTSAVSNALVKMQRGLKNGDVDLFMKFLKVILSDLKYNWQPPRQYKNEAELFRMWEGYFHAILYIITSYMSLSVKAEVQHNKGRVDLIAEVENFIYLMEFKLDGTSTNAIEQIKSREYAATYQSATKKVFLVGVNFSNEDRNVEDYEVEVWAE